MPKIDIPVSACVLVAILAVTGCVSVSSEIVGSDQDHVWIRKPIVGEGGAVVLAAEYCARFEKTAVFDSELTISDAKRIVVYACQ
jgi:hypothetical protein